MPIDESRPWVSENCRVHPDYAKAASEDLKKLGVQNAYFDNQGRAVAHSKQSRNAVLKYMGMMDRGAGYSDYAGS
jgi:hypothetical protein